MAAQVCVTRFIVATVPSNCPDAEHLQPSLEVGEEGAPDRDWETGTQGGEEARWAADLPRKQGTRARAACPHPGKAGKRDPR